MSNFFNYLKRYITLNNILLLISFLLLLNLLTQIKSFTSYISIALQIFQPLLIGYLISYLLYPLLIFFEKYVSSRFFSLCMIFLLIVGLIIIFILKLYPIIYVNLIELMNFIFKYISSINQEMSYYHISIDNIINTIQNHIISPSVIESFFLAFSNVISFVGNLLTYIIFSIYFLLNYESINKKIKECLAFIHPSIPIYIKAINFQLHQYIKVYVLLMFVQFLLNYIVLRIIQHPYYAIISVTAGISSLLPYIGPIVISFLTILTALPLTTAKLIILIVALIIISNVDSYIITPRIYGKQMNISSFLVIFTILTASKLLGLYGVILAVPSLIIIKTIITTYQLENKKKC